MIGVVIQIRIYRCRFVVNLCGKLQWWGLTNTEQPGIGSCRVSELNFTVNVMLQHIIFRYWYKVVDLRPVHAPEIYLHYPPIILCVRTYTHTHEQSCLDAFRLVHVTSRNTIYTHTVVYNFTQAILRPNTWILRVCVMLSDRRDSKGHLGKVKTITWHSCGIFINKWNSNTDCALKSIKGYRLWFSR